MVSCLHWSFWCGVAASAGAIFASLLDIVDSPIITAVLLFVLCASGIGYSVALWCLAVRLGKRPIVWVGGAFVTQPFGAPVSYALMCRALKESQERGKAT